MDLKDEDGWGGGDSVIWGVKVPPCSTYERIFMTSVL